MESTDTFSMHTSQKCNTTNLPSKLNSSYLNEVPVVKKTRSRETINSISRIPKVSTTRNSDRISHLKKSATELSTAERDINTSKQSIQNFTPLKESNRTISSMIKSSNKSHKNSSMKGCEEKIQALFENAFSIKEEQLSVIDQSVKSQKLGRMISFDNSDKMKKNAQAIKDYKNMIQTLFLEIRLLKENCIQHQSSLINNINDIRTELIESENSVESFKLNEIRYKKDILKIRDDFAKASAAKNLLEEKNRELLDQLKDNDHKLLNQLNKLETEQTLKQHAEAKSVKLEDEILLLKKEMFQSINQSKEQYEERLNECINTYKNEILSLKSELSKKQADVMKSSEEREENDRKATQLREEFLLVQSVNRENDNTIKRLEKENEKLLQDISTLREQINTKDIDLRQTLQSLSDAQRFSSEEKCELKIEIGMLKNCITSLEEDKKHLMNEISNKKTEFFSLNQDYSAIKELNSNLVNKVNELESYSSQIKDLENKLEIERELRVRSEVKEEDERRERIAACAQLIAIQTDTMNKLREMELNMVSKVEFIQFELDGMREQRDLSVEQVDKHMETIIRLQSEISQLKHALDTTTTTNNTAAVEELSKVSGELEIMRRRIRETNDLKSMENSILANKVHLLEEQLKENESQRRKLHNTIQELRGNIRVYARIRPFLPNDQSKSPEPVITIRSDEVSLKVVKKPTSDFEKLEEYVFNYDKVFGPSSSQESVFNEVSEFVQSALDGYNVCIFSYGQTGSGKTHTMQGSGTGPMRGIIPRAMEQVGVYKNTLEEKGWIYTMEISFIEIYNETIRDLLRTTHSDEIKHDIKKDSNGNSFVSDITLRLVDPNNTSQLESIIELAATHRSVGQTAMNERSSRSHSIFTLHLTAYNKLQNMTLKGSLNLVDLAGSERLDRSGVSGSRLKESVAINKSLSSLTDVFVAIANKQSHIPFRNSKLTYLLQPALCGDGKTLMLVNISPTEESCQESLCSLRMASQVNQCELGKPKKSIKESSNSSDNKILSSCSVPQSPRPPITNAATRKASKK